VGDFLRGFVFVLCQLLLLGLVLSPLLLLKRDANPPARIPMSVKTFMFGVAVGAIIMTAGIDISSLSRQHDTANRGLTPSSSPGGSPVAANREMTPEPATRKLTRDVLQGKPVVIRFDPEACTAFNLGTIECGTDYQGQYDASVNSWTVTGFHKGEGTVRTFVSTNTDRGAGNVSVWGMLSRFGDDGTIHYLNEVVGTIRLQTNAAPTIPPVVAQTATDRAPPRPGGPMLTTEVLLGKPVLIRFDAHACVKFNLGTIECESNYRGQYEAAHNGWTVSGFHKGENGVRTFTSTNADQLPGSLSVWGMINRFDDDGIVYYRNEKVGTIRLQPG
jgi:hypothetical protein